MLKKSKGRYSVWKIFCIKKVMEYNEDIQITVLQFPQVSKALFSQLDDEYNILKIDYSEGKFIPNNIFSMDYDSFIRHSKYSYCMGGPKA